jgi:hypothetical protein
MDDNIRAYIDQMYDLGRPLFHPIMLQVHFALKSLFLKTHNQQYWMHYRWYIRNYYGRVR